MTALSLLFRNLAGARHLPSQIGVLTLDVTVEESHDFSADVTEFPIEGGAVITDHVRLRPRQLNITGFVTDTPLVSVGLSLGRSRAASAFFTLETMWQMRIPFVVVSQLRIYRSMVIEKLSVPKAREQALRFSCTMKQIQIVYAQTTMVPEMTGNTKNGGGAGKLTDGNTSRVGDQAGQDAGRQVGDEVEPAKMRSTLGDLSGIYDK
jgi:hypothetical protein